MVNFWLVLNKIWGYWERWFISGYMVNLFHYFGYMVILDIWSILAGPDVDHVSGTHCMYFSYLYHMELVVLDLTTVIFGLIPPT